MIKATTYFENQIKGILLTLKHIRVCNNYIKLNETQAIKDIQFIVYTCISFKVEK